MDFFTKNKIGCMLGPLFVQVKVVSIAAEFLNTVFLTKLSFRNSDCCEIWFMNDQQAKVVLMNETYTIPNSQKPFPGSNFLSLSADNVKKCCDAAESAGGLVVEKASHWALIQGAGLTIFVFNSQQNPSSLLGTYSSEASPQMRNSSRQDMMRRPYSSHNLKLQSTSPHAGNAVKKEAQEISTPSVLNEFPELKVLLYSNGIRFPFYPNSIAPVPFENEFFEGFCFLAVKGSKHNPHVNHLFEGKKRLLDFQLQGRFKRKPKGILYLGGELTQNMQLSLLTRGCCRVLLGVGQTLTNGKMQYSFGNSDGSVRPHIAVPLVDGLKCLIKTPPGEIPPQLGKLLKYDGEFNTEWDLESVFTFSCNFMYASLERWELSGLPTGPMSLHTFWKDSALRLVIYELGEEDTNKEHLQAFNRYFMMVELSHIPASEGQSLETVNAHQMGIQENSDEDTRASVQLSDELFDVDIGENRASWGLPSPGYTEMYSPAQSPSSRPSTLSCPIWIEIAKQKVPANMRKAYLYVVVWGNSVRLRSEGDVRRHLPKLDLSQPLCLNDRQSEQEVKRCFIEQTLNQLQSSNEQHHKQSLVDFTTGRSRYDEMFLNQPINRTVEIPSSIGTVIVQGFGCRAISRKHWVEEGFLLTLEYLIFLKPGKKKPTMKVSTSSIIQVCEVEPSAFILPGVYCLEISTIGRCYYLMLNETCFQMWSQKMQELCETNRKLSRSKSSPSLLDGMPVVSAIEECFLLKSNEWKLGNRRLLNCRKLMFHEQAISNELRDPCKLVELLLEQAFSLEAANIYELKSFLDGTCRLADTSVLRTVQSHETNQQIAFYLNLYHLMVMHGFIVLGPPHNLSSFISFFTQVSYEVGGDIFSLAELEHRIIRAGMNSPQTFSKYFIPQTKYDFALTVSDSRLIFAVNCGAVANYPSVPVYTAEALDRQLTSITQLTLEKTVKVDMVRKRITLPKMFQWYQKDFGLSSIDMLCFIKQNIAESNDQNQGINWALQQKKSNKLTILYDEYLCQCQQLSKIMF